MKYVDEALSNLVAFMRHPTGLPGVLSAKVFAFVFVHIEVRVVLHLNTG